MRVERSSLKSFLHECDLSYGILKHISNWSPMRWYSLDLSRLSIDFWKFYVALHHLRIYNQLLIAVIRTHPLHDGTDGKIDDTSPIFGPFWSNVFDESILANFGQFDKLVSRFDCTIKMRSSCRFTNSNLDNSDAFQRNERGFKVKKNLRNQIVTIAVIRMHRPLDEGRTRTRLRPEGGKGIHPHQEDQGEQVPMGWDYDGTLSGI